MITFFIVLILVGALTAHAMRFSPEKASFYDDATPRGIRLVIPIGIAATFMIWAAVATGIAYDQAADIRNSQYVIEQLEDQRDQLAVVFNDVLSNDDYIQLIEAATPEDIKFLSTRPDVSAFLIQRADRIVAINARVYAEQNRLLRQARLVCNFNDNPIVPKFPFIGPDCTLGTLQESFK